MFDSKRGKLDEAIDAKVEQIVNKFSKAVSNKTDDLKHEVYSMTTKIHEDVVCAVGFFGMVAVINTALLIGILYKTGRK